MARRKAAGHLGSLADRDRDRDRDTGSRGLRSRLSSSTPPASSPSSSAPRSSPRRGGQPGGLAALKARRQARNKASSQARSAREEERGGKVRVLLIIGAVIALLVAGYTVFTYLIPHTDVVITTAYKDSWSGKFVQTEVNNKGTEPLLGLKISVAVWNGSQLMDSVEESVGDLEAHSNHTIQRLHFYGHSLDQYTIVVQVSFKTAGENFQETYTYDSEPVQSHLWEDKIFKWN